tara:strand:- start:1959 stop:2342 length:384 start_codon:yes stop_codon:yes gene_type:complete
MKKYVFFILSTGFFLFSFALAPSPSLAKKPYRTLALKAAGAENNKAAEINNEGIRHFTEKHWTESGEFFEDAVKTDPNLAVAHFNLALVHHKKNRHKEAAGHFKKAAELAPNDSRIQNSEILKEHIK